MNEEKSIEAVSSLISHGTATAEERGLALKAISDGMSSQLVGMMHDATTPFARLSALLSTAVDRFTTMYQTQLEQDMVQIGDLKEFILDVQNQQIKFIDLYRKIIQSPNPLFPETSLSDEERKVLALFKSFKTVEERNAFLKICEQQMAPKPESFEE